MESLQQNRLGSKKAYDLFDISHCQCKEFRSCQCVKEKKVPRAEQEFLRDQRSSRKMYIGEVNRKAEKMKERKATREDRLETRRLEEKQRRMESQKTILCEFENDDAGFSTSSSESLETEQPKDMPDTGNRNMISIPTIALEADRYGVSNRGTAAISTAAIIDYGVINPNDKANIIDHHKIWRARQNTRKELRQSKDFITTSITAIFFDGRKN